MRKSDPDLGRRLRDIDRTGARFWPRGEEGKALYAPERVPSPDSRLPPMHPVDTSRGRTWVCREAFPLSRRHGSARIGDLRWVDPRNLALLARSTDLREIEPDEVLFLDVETTGLMSGAGLYVFLVGLGYLEGNRFVVEQHFLRDPGDEPAFLEAILQRWGSFRGIVTYNGRQFDAPRLVDRVRFQRLDTPVPSGYHLDLFLLARRVWRGAFESLGLQDLEARVLGLVRTDDLPGALCPIAYAGYLRGDGGGIGEVFRHNLDDILSLATLTARLDRVVRRPRGPFEQAAVAMGLEESGKIREALVLYESALEGLPGGMATRGRRRRAAALQRRSGDLGRAVEIWRDLWAEGDLRSARNLAIALEHRFHRFRAAERIVKEALGSLGGRPGMPTRGRRDWEKRLARIRRKIVASRGGSNGGRSN